MKNFVQTGDTLDLTAPVGGVVSGTTVQIGSLVVVPVVSAAAGAKFAVSHKGVYTLPIKAGDSPAEGGVAYWDGTAGTWTVTAGSLTLGGYFVGAEIGTSNTANIKLLG